MGMPTLRRDVSGPTVLRGIQSVRAEYTVADLVKKIDEIGAGISQSFHELKEENDKFIADKFKDVVQNEKVDRINGDITGMLKRQSDLEAQLTAANERIVALQVGGDAEPGVAPEVRAHQKAFNGFLRSGVETGLRDFEVKAALRTDSDPDGGYIAPVEVDMEISRVQSVVSALRRVAQVRMITAGSFKKPVNLGGGTSGWVGEREARTETDTPTLAVLEFPAMELYANPAATQTMLDDTATDVEQWLSDEVGIIFAEAEGTAFITGTGVNQPRGLLGYTPVANASYAWGRLGYIATAVAADINDGTYNGVDALTDLVYALKQGYRPNASFLMNRTLQGKVRKLKTLGDTAAYLWQPSVQAGQPPTLLGYPIADDDNMPDVGANAYPIAFGDFRRGYLIVDRMGIRVLRDPYTNKPYIHFYTTKRVGGGVQNFEAIKLLKCAAS